MIKKNWGRNKEEAELALTVVLMAVAVTCIDSFRLVNLSICTSHFVTSLDGTSKIEEVP